MSNPPATSYQRIRQYLFTRPVESDLPRLPVVLFLMVDLWDSHKPFTLFGRVAIWFPCWGVLAGCIAVLGFPTALLWELVALLYPLIIKTPETTDEIRPGD